LYIITRYIDRLLTWHGFLTIILISRVNGTCD